MTSKKDKSSELDVIAFVASKDKKSSPRTLNKFSKKRKRLDSKSPRSSKKAEGVKTITSYFQPVSSRHKTLDLDSSSCEMMENSSEKSPSIISSDDEEMIVADEILSDSSSQSEVEESKRKKKKIKTSK